MSGTRTLTISRHLVHLIEAEARRAAPAECCGLIAGRTSATGWHADDVHPAQNLAPDARGAFLIDPAAQFGLLRRLRGTGRDVIGCYHSHPDGAARPSERDREAAMDDGFLWLIAADVVAAFAFDAIARRFVPVPMRHV